MAFGARFWYEARHAGGSLQEVGSVSAKPSWLGYFFLCLGLGISSQGSASKCATGLVFHAGLTPGITRLRLESLYPLNRIYKPNGSVFYDPADTYTFTFATMDVVDDKSQVLELGSGMGLASAMMSSRVARVHGVDISAESVEFANEHYSSDRVSFSLHDYLLNGTKDLLNQWPISGQRPDILAANPPYVPCDSREICRQLPDGAWASMYGGPRGTRYHFEIINYADSLGIDRLALCMGSYSTPVAIFEHLEKFGYRVIGLTLTAVLNGRFSELNQGRINALANAGQAYTWERTDGKKGYIIVGLAIVRNSALGAKQSPVSREQFTKVLSLAAASKTNSLELLTPESVGRMSVRILSE